MSPSDIEKKVRDLGYDVVTEKKEFDITGMTVQLVQHELKKGLIKWMVLCRQMSI